MSKKSKCSIEKLKDLPNNITKKIYNQVITTIYISATESKIIALLVRIRSVGKYS